MAKKSRRKEQPVDLRLDDAENQLLESVVAALQIPPCDLLVIGDGSGNRWDKACGWAAVLIEVATRRRRLFYGAMNFGSIEFAELMPYVQALAWYDNRIAGQEEVRTPKRVAIVTDSEVLTRHVQELRDPAVQPSRTLSIPLAMFRAFRDGGYDISMLWYRRQTLALNALSDLIAGLSRSQLMLSEGWRDLESQWRLAERAAEALNAVRATVNGQTPDIYRINPEGQSLWTGTSRSPIDRC